MNVNKGGVYKAAALRKLFEDFSCDVIGLQEVNVNPFSNVNFVEDWRSHGFTCLLGDFDADANVYRVAIVSRVPMRQVTLPGISAASRYVAGVFEAQRSHGVEKVVFCTIYGHANCFDSACNLVQEVTSGLAQLHDNWMLLGDFNMTASEGSVCQLLSNGAAFSMDEPFWTSPLPGTYGDERRIDYGLSCKFFHPIALDHTNGVGDHTAVRYQLDFTADFLGRVGPRHARQLFDSSYILGRFNEVWDSNAFDFALQANNVDAAWNLLSCAAEQSLFSDFANGRQRSDVWKPRPQRHHSKAANGGESLGLVRLRRCIRRVKQLGFQPWDVCLRDKIARDVSFLLPLFSQLADLEHFSMEHQVPLLEQVLMEAVQSERQQRLSQWQGSVESSLCKQSAWIKRKSNIALALGSTSSTSSSTAQQVRHVAIHPVQQIKQAEEIWLRHWSADPAANTVEYLDRLQRFIADAQPGAPAYQVDVPWNASVLQQVARTMAGKAAGPDHWQTDTLLLLPDTWWDAFARLWAVVYGTSLDLRGGRTLESAYSQSLPAICAP
eukprot:s919_g8.t1